MRKRISGKRVSGKRVLTAALALVMAGSLAACGESASEGISAHGFEQIPEGARPEDLGQGPQEEAPAEETAPESYVLPADMYYSELTGEPISRDIENQRPVAIMIDNDARALPHFGISNCDVMYELMNSTANNRITRLMCLFKDWGAIEKAGSIRSIRPTNILLGQEWDAVLCHDGGPFYIDPYLANDYAAHFSGGFDRVNNGKAREFTEYICTGNLDQKFDASKYSKEYNDFYPGAHYKFAESEVTLADADGSISATEISLPFKHNKSTLKYNEDTQTYDYYEYGSAHVDAGNNNEVLSFKNVLIQNCTFHQYDENGYLIYNCIDTGRDGYYVTNGKAIPITWAKTGDTEPTRYFDKDGNEIEINTGKTYVTLVPDDGWSSMTIK